MSDLSISIKLLGTHIDECKYICETHQYEWLITHINGIQVTFPKQCHNKRVLIKIIDSIIKDVKIG